MLVSLVAKMTNYTGVTLGTKIEYAFTQSRIQTAPTTAFSSFRIRINGAVWIRDYISPDSFSSLEHRPLPSFRVLVIQS